MLAIIIGNSMGGHSAVASALANPSRVGKLILMGGGTGGPSQFVPMRTEGIKLLQGLYRELAYRCRGAVGGGGLFPREGTMSWPPGLRKTTEQTANRGTIGTGRKGACAAGKSREGYEFCSSEHRCPSIRSNLGLLFARRWSIDLVPPAGHPRV